MCGVCVCVCVRACVRARACVCVNARVCGRIDRITRIQAPHCLCARPWLRCVQLLCVQQAAAVHLLGVLGMDDSKAHGAGPIADGGCLACRGQKSPYGILEGRAGHLRPPATHATINGCAQPCAQRASRALQHQAARQAAERSAAAAPGAVRPAYAQGNALFGGAIGDQRNVAEGLLHGLAPHAVLGSRRGRGGSARAGLEPAQLPRRPRVSGSPARRARARARTAHSARGSQRSTHASAQRGTTAVMWSSISSPGLLAPSSSAASSDAMAAAVLEVRRSPKIPVPGESSTVRGQFKVSDIN